MAAALSIVVVEDHDALRELTVGVLRRHGHHAIGVDCAEALADTVGGRPVDLFVVDVALPGEDGLSLARRLRRIQPAAGIVIMTARDALHDKVAGYDSGADIYLTKPVAAEELLGAIAALGRRLGGGPAPAGLAEAAWVLDMRTMRLHGPRGVAPLSDTEVAMLGAFARSPGQQLEVWQLLELLQVDADAYAKASLEVRIVRLRKKLQSAGADAGALKALRLRGYQLCVPLRLQAGGPGDAA